MTMKTRGFLLFGFAFASVLSSSEFLTSSKSSSSKIIRSASTDKPSTVFTKSHTQGLYHDLRKRAIEIYQQSAYPKMKYNNEIENAFETEKKSENRFRFTGMRGKKNYESVYIESDPVVDTEKVEGALNKKEEQELYKGKRASLTFHGMRGKKFEDLDSKKINQKPFDFNSLSSIQKYLINSGLVNDMNTPESDYPEDVTTTDNEEWDNVFSKRSPYSFEELQGKKGSLYDFKRSLGFMGMRGKKGTDVWSRYFGYKRVPQSSFFGMKGKKAQSGFFGMRGKKSEEGTHEPFTFDFQNSGLFDKIKEEYKKSEFREEKKWPTNLKKNSFYVPQGQKSTNERLESQLFSSKE